MIAKMMMGIDQYHVLFGRVRESIMSNPDKDLREKLIYHWNTSPVGEKIEVVNDMLEKGILKIPPKHERRK